MTEFTTMKQLYQQRDMAAKEWKQNGGKVVGYFCDNVPEELILAAGFFPLRISGDPKGSTDEADKCRFRQVLPEGYVSSMLNMLLTGKYDFLDYLVFSSRRTILSLPPMLSDAKKSLSVLNTTEFYSYHNLNTTFLASQMYNRDMLLEFKKQLETWSGKDISQESLVKAIGCVNTNRKLQKEVAALRIADPPRISGTDALQIIGASMFMLKEDHNILLRKYLDKKHELPTRKGVRLFVESSPLDNLQLYEIIESCEATVVAEDNCWGTRYSDALIDSSLDPLEAIVDRYFNKSACPIMHPLERRVNYCVKSSLEARADGVIFNYIKNDNTQGWEIPDEMKKLQDLGIPTLLLKSQPYLITDPQVVKATVQNFIEEIKVNKQTLKSNTNH